MPNERRLNIRVAEAINILAEGIVGVKRISDHKGQIAAQGELHWGANARTPSARRMVISVVTVRRVPGTLPFAGADW